MPIRVQCPSCAAALLLPDAVQGKVVKLTCKKCGTAFSHGKSRSAPPAGPMQAGRPPMRPPMNDGGPPRRRPPEPVQKGSHWILFASIGGGALLVAVGIVLFLVLRQPSPEKQLADALEKEFKEGFKDLGTKDAFKDMMPKDAFKDLGKDPFKDLSKDAFKDFTKDPFKDLSKKIDFPLDKKDGIKIIDPGPPPAKEPIVHKTDAGIRHITLSPDGKYLAVAVSDIVTHTVKVYQWPDFTLKREWKFESSGKRSLIFSRDSRTLFAAGFNVFASPPGLVAALDVESGKELGTQFSFMGGPEFLAISPTGTHFVSGNNNQLFLWNAATRRIENQVKPVVEGKAYLDHLQGGIITPDGKIIFITQITGTERGQVRVWDPAAGETILLRDIGRMRQVLVTKDGSKILAVHHNGRTGGGVSCWDRAGKEIWFWQTTSPREAMWCIALSQDEKHVAVGGNDNIIRVLDAADGKVRGGFTKTEYTHDLIFQDDGRLISSHGDGSRSIKIWDLGELRPVDGRKEVIVKKDGGVDPDKDKKTPPVVKGPDIVERRGGVLKHADTRWYVFEFGGKSIGATCEDKGVIWLDPTGKVVSEGPRRMLLANPGNIVDVKLRETPGKPPELLEVKVVTLISDIPIRPGNFELKNAKVKDYRSRNIVFVAADGKEHKAIISAMALCRDQTGKELEGVDAQRIFKIDNVVDVWLYPEKGRDFNHVNVGKLVSGGLMTDEELKKIPPPLAVMEKKVGRIRVDKKGGFSLAHNPKPKAFVNYSLFIDESRPPKAYDTEGKEVPWRMIFHQNNEVEMVMESRGTHHTPLEVKLIKGVVK